MAAELTSTVGGNVRVTNTNSSVAEDRYFTPIELDAQLETFGAHKVIRFYERKAASKHRSLVIEISNQSSLPGWGNLAFGLTNPDQIKAEFDALADAYTEAGVSSITGTVGLTQAQAKAAIETATNLDGLEGSLTTLATRDAYKVTDGTNTARVKAASTSAVQADPALVVTLSPNSVPIATTALKSAAVHNEQVIAVANVAQDALPANPNRSYFEVTNTDATRVLYINIGGTASANSVKIFPDNFYNLPPGVTSTAKVSVFSAFAGHRFTTFEL